MEKRSGPSAPSDTLVQTRRRANLRHLLQLLEDDGIQGWAAQAALLANVSGKDLQALVAGEPISDELAREIEWGMNRPQGWLDRHPEGPLDD